MTGQESYDKKHKPYVRIRRISWQHDLPQVMDIDYKTFKSPWKKEDFLNCQRQAKCVGYVAELERKVAGEVKRKVVGYMIYEADNNKKLWNIAVDEDYRRLGIGTQLIEKLIGKLPVKKRHVIITDVRETNLPAQLFFHDCGFVQDKTLRDNYLDTHEDAYIMKLGLLSFEQKVIRSLERLESLTGAQWELVRMKGFGEYEPFELPGVEGNITTSSRLALRTRGTIKNPKLANSKLNELWHTEAHVYENTHNGGAQVILPVESISQVYINRGKDGQLADYFELSQNAKPESLAEKERNRENKGTQQDGGMGGR